MVPVTGRVTSIDTALSGALRLRHCSAPDAMTRALPASSVVLGLVREIPSRLRKSANLVCTLARSQFLYRVRLEALVQNRDLSRQGIDEDLGRV